MLNERMVVNVTTKRGSYVQENVGSKTSDEKFY